MKEEIEKKLQSIVNHPFQCANRATNMICFGFGGYVSSNNKFGGRLVTEYYINIQCSWRIVSNEKIIVASRDIYSPNSKWDEDDEDFDWDVDQNRCDELLENYFNNQKELIYVTSISADNYYGVKIYLSNDHIIEIFPDQTDEGELWRILESENMESEFVITGLGIE